MTSAVAVPAAVMVVVSLATLGAARQAPSGPKNVAAAKATPLRTTWGDPDLQGVWTSNVMTGVPVERPSEFGDRELLTDEEFAKRQRDAERAAVDNKADRRPGQTGAGPEHWYEWWGRSSRRTSLVVDPKDGRIPITPEAKNRAAAARSRPADSWEDLGTWMRCITRALPSAMIPTAYNNAYQILQTPGYVIIRSELVDKFRIIPMDGRPHVDSRIRQWVGDSRGRWDGNTLVVDVTNFSDKTNGTAEQNGSYRGGSESMHLVERFTRVDADTVEYRATVEDPKNFTRPWTLAISLKKDDNYQIFEYACHEGNHSIANALSGARAQEKAAGGTAQKP
jgi:hypothetical protein